MFPIVFFTLSCELNVKYKTIKNRRVKVSHGRILPILI